MRSELEREASMKILVLNGSPKGEYSITLQYARFIQKKFPQHELKVLHISKPIKKIEGDEAAFREIIDEIRSSDGVLWIFGLWVLGAPAQYMRFIELVSERGAQDAFRGKYAAVLTTSIHYFDHLAHDYMRAVCEDMGMRYVEGLSLGMRDLNEGSHREVLGLFAGNFFDTIAKKAATSRLFRPLVFSDFVYHPSAQQEKIDNRGKKTCMGRCEFMQDLSKDCIKELAGQPFYEPVFPGRVLQKFCELPAL